MKNIIVAGVSRAGKSTLAKDIAKKYNIMYFPFDVIVSTLENLYPAVGIMHMDENEIISSKIVNFLEEFLKHLSYEDINYIIDLYQVFPKDLNKILNPKDHLTLYLGYSNISVESKLKHLKDFARDKDWTKNVSDNELKTILTKFIKESRLMEQECLKVDYKFFDTGENFNEAIEEAKLFIDNNI